MVRLVLTSTGSGLEGHPPLALGYIASYLRKYLKLNKIKIVDKESDPVKAILKERPDVVGISSATLFFNQASKIARDIKSQLDIPVIIGGQHITQMQYALSKEFDVAVLGEGEQTTLNLMQTYLDCHEFNSKNLKKIKGIAFHENGNVVINERQTLITPLDKIPYPARDLFKMNEIYLIPRLTFVHSKISRSTHMLTSRGCPYRCVFCASSCFWRTIRYHSPEYVVGEIKEMIRNFKIHEINIFDDLFIADKKRFRKIVELLESEGITKKCRFRILGRANLINKETCELIKRMGVASIGIGFESGSPKILKYLKKGTTTVQQNKFAIKLLKQYGIAVQGLFMIGSPHETKQDMMKTLEFIKNNSIDTLELSITTPYPGTELWAYAKKRGFVSDAMDWSRLDAQPLNDLKDNILLDEEISREEFIKIYQLFRKELEKRNICLLNSELADILSLGLIKLAIKRPSKTIKIASNFIKAKFQKR